MVPVVAAATLTGVAAAFVSLQGGPTAPQPSHRALPATAAEASFTGGRVAPAVRSDVAAAKARTARHVKRMHLEQQRAAQQAQQAAAAAPPASPAPAASPPPVSGGNAADSALGICIRNAEEGGSYAWGPGNGGGAYQFALGTWEAYGGAASEFGVPAGLPGSDLRQRHRCGRRLELDGLRRVLTTRRPPGALTRPCAMTAGGPVRTRS